MHRALGLSSLSSLPLALFSVHTKRRAYDSCESAQANIQFWAVLQRFVIELSCLLPGLVLWPIICSILTEQECWLGSLCWHDEVRDSLTVLALLPTVVIDRYKALHLPDYIVRHCFACANGHAHEHHPHLPLPPSQIRALSYYLSLSLTNSQSISRAIAIALH